MSGDVRDSEAQLVRGRRGFEGVEAIHHLQHHHKTRDIETPFLDEVRDPVQAAQVRVRVEPLVAGLAGGLDEAGPLVFAQRLRMHPSETRRDGDGVHAVALVRHPRRRQFVAPRSP